MLVNSTSKQDFISGTVERVTYHNPENGFCVLRINVKGKKDSVTVVGHINGVFCGEFIQAHGLWINDKSHGPQFKAERLDSSAPDSLEGIQKYLGSGLIKGIGPVYAKKLVDIFGSYANRVGRWGLIAIDLKPRKYIPKLVPILKIPKQDDFVVFGLHTPRRGYFSNIPVELSDVFIAPLESN